LLLLIIGRASGDATHATPIGASPTRFEPVQYRVGWNCIGAAASLDEVTNNLVHRGVRTRLDTLTSVADRAEVARNSCCRSTRQRHPSVGRAMTLVVLPDLVIETVALSAYQSAHK